MGTLIYYKADNSNDKANYSKCTNDTLCLFLTQLLFPNFLNHHSHKKAYDHKKYYSNLRT